MKKITFLPGMVASILLGGITLAKASAKDHEAKEFQLEPGKDIKINLTAEKGDYFPYSEVPEKGTLEFAKPKGTDVVNTLNTKTTYELTLTVNEKYEVSNNGIVMLVRYNTATKDCTICKMIVNVDQTTGKATMHFYEVTTLTATKNENSKVVVKQYEGTKLELLIAELCKNLRLIQNLKHVGRFSKTEAAKGLPPVGYGVVSTNVATGLQSVTARKDKSETPDSMAMELLWNDVTDLLNAPIDGTLLKINSASNEKVLEAELLNS